MSDLEGYYAQYFPAMEVVTGSSDLLKRVPHAAVSKCIDDRPVAGFYVSATDRLGPALQGGALGHAYLAAVTEEVGMVGGQYFERILDREINMGVRPGVHDMNPLHCKHAEITLSGGFGGPRVTMSRDEIVEILRAKGGVELRLSGHHAARLLRLNTRPGYTLEADNTAYNFDQWWASMLGLNMQVVLSNLYLTASSLNVSKVEVIA